jgi:lipopolysaccharide transport system ATP-binding protein
MIAQPAEVVIKVENLGKKYRIRHQQERQPYVSLREAVAGRATALGRKALAPFSRPPAPATPVPSSDREDFWALHDVSFDIRRGEVVGIIGRNGAGKSTLLKILSRITEPTSGRVGLKGQVASLLEVGTGFHPELTGRENIYLNGAILGMRRAEIKAKFDEIVAFAEIEKFLDTPVKRYSSGMYVRLAFAVAAHLDPEILVIDEVLAVGDAEFQNKCLGKMREVATGLGRTVLFVSHNLSAVRTLCHRGIVLHCGGIEYDGEIGPALEAYSRLSASEPLLRSPKPDRPTIIKAIVDEQQACSGNLKLDVEFSSPWPLDPVLIGAVVNNHLGSPIFGFNTWMDSCLHPQPASRGIATLFVPNVPLHSGTYQVAVFLGEKTQNYDVVERAATFDFVSPQSLPGGLNVETIGPLRVNGSWQIIPND